LISEPLRRFKFAPILTATVLTVLLLWLFKTVAHVFLLLFLGILIALYLGAVTDSYRRLFRVPPRVAYAAALLSTLAAIVLLFWIIIPPVVAQTQALIQALPTFITDWEQGVENAIQRFPALREIWPPGEHRVVRAIYDQLAGLVGDLAPRVFTMVHVGISIVAVAAMAVYLSLQPALYREWVIALFPPIHRDLVRDVLADLADTLRAYIVGQLLAMGFLAAITVLGLYLLDVPFYLPFGIFAGLVTVVPFFGTLVSTLLPALFVLQGPGFLGMGGLTHALMVVGLGIVVNLIEGNVVAPLVMSRKVKLPPVLTLMAVLVMGTLLGFLGLIVAVPTLAALMVIMRRILITRIYEGQGFRRTTRERPLVLRVPAAGDGVLVPRQTLDVIGHAERGGSRSAG
jgi:predicted PurR-regulated permease PerM